MEKSTVLELVKTTSERFMYHAKPILDGNRKLESIAKFRDERSDFYFGELGNLPTIFRIDSQTKERYRLIEFYKRVNHQLFGKNFHTGKCVYGVFSHPWHKKTITAELGLFESKVNFEDLYWFDYQGGKYVPEFSNKFNWANTYYAAEAQNSQKVI